MSPRLVFVSGPLEGDAVELREESITVGRHPDRDLHLPQDIVSRHQATIGFEAGSYVLRDEGSTNGTFVNDRKIREQVLHDGDRIEFGLGGPSARFELSEWDALGATAEVRTPASSSAAGEAAAARGPTERVRCPSCGDAFAVPSEERTGEGAVYVWVDPDGLPDGCPACGAHLDPGRLGEMIIRSG